MTRHHHLTEAQILETIAQCNAGGETIAAEILGNLPSIQLVDVYEHVTQEEADDSRAWLITEIIDIICAADYDPNMT